jgi:hypothetical protein
VCIYADKNLLCVGSAAGVLLGTTAATKYVTGVAVELGMSPRVKRDVAASTSEKKNFQHISHASWCHCVHIKHTHKNKSFMFCS